MLHGSSSVPQEYVKIINTHGGALKDAVGIPEEQLRKAAKSAVCKINIDSDGRLAMTAAIRKIFVDQPAEFDPRKYLGPARDEPEETLHAQVRERAGFGRQGLIRNIPTKKPGLSRPGFFRFRRALPENGGSGEKSRKGAEFRTQSDAETSDIPRSGRDRTESSN